MRPDGRDRARPHLRQWRECFMGSSELLSMIVIPRRSDEESAFRRERDAELRSAGRPRASVPTWGMANNNELTEN
jgi:formiminotetrahydrofolate cyclodeaminase